METPATNMYYHIKVSSIPLIQREKKKKNPYDEQKTLTGEDLRSTKRLDVYA